MPGSPAGQQLVTHGPATRPCTVCGKKGDQRCIVCRVDYYCSKEHQRQDWPRHKKGCGCIAVHVDSRVGRHLVATKDIPAGTVLMREIPLVAFPNGGPDLVCVGCCRILKRSEAKSCVRCGLEVCGTACSQRREHLPECNAFKRAKFKFQAGITSIPKYALIALRVCLASKEPLLGERLWALQSDVPDPGESRPDQDCTLPPEAEKNATNWLRNGIGVGFLEAMSGLSVSRNEDVTHQRVLKAKRELEQHCREAADWLRDVARLRWLDAGELRRFAGASFINGQGVVTLGYESKVSGLFAGLSLLEHACLPNVTVAPSAALDVDVNAVPFGAFEIEVIAARSISRGEHLTLSYIDLPFVCTFVRRAQLAEGWGFHCACALCADPTEGGLHLGAWYCGTCKDRGSQQLVSLSSSGLCWKCRGCGRGGPVGAVSNTLDRVFVVSGADAYDKDIARDQAIVLGQRLQAIREKSFMNEDVALEEWERFLDEALWPRGPLHATSQTVLCAKRQMIKCIPRSPRRVQDLSGPACETLRLAGYCRDMLAAADTLCPGHIELRRGALKRLVQHSRFRLALLSRAPQTFPRLWPTFHRDLLATKQEIADNLPEATRSSTAPHDQKWLKKLGEDLKKI